MPSENPLVDDRDIEFQLYEVHDAASLTGLPAFAEHDRTTFDLFIGGVRRLAREELWPAYRAMDESPPKLEAGRVRAHPQMAALWPRMVELGLLAATRPPEALGSSLPLLVSTAADVYLMAANASAFGYVGLTRGAAHLVEAFGDESLRERFMVPLLEGRWTGTMALTEPQAGSSLADVATKATPTSGGHYLLEGAKIFISAADHGITANVLNMVLARIEGAPAGSAGISLFAVPHFRGEQGAWVENDVSVAGLIHKIGWRGLPSLSLSFGERGDCHGWLVGPEHRGLACMFQMMNEARIMIGLNGVATASVAYHASLAYARERTQGRPIGERDPARRAVALTEHADVRRMLLRQKAIIEGGLSLVMQAARWSDVAAHGPAGDRERAAALLDLITPIAKSFPAERGFEANTLALQIHGGYGYSSEYLPEAWLRDQKLNSIHEGTTGIQAIDLLGRKVLREGGRSLVLLAEEMRAAVASAAQTSVDPRLGAALGEAIEKVADLAVHLGKQAQRDAARAMAHASDFLDLMSTVVIAWQWLRQATAAARALEAGRGPEGFYRAKLAAAAHFFDADLTRVDGLIHQCKRDESFVDLDPNWL